jgi:iron complex transport system permease protein
MWRVEMVTVQQPGKHHRPGHRVIRTRYAAYRVNVQVLGMTLAALLLLALLMVWAVTLGAIDLSMKEVIDATLGEGDAKTSLVVNTLRWPRIMSAVVIGCSLAIAGLIFQGIARNPLVSPDIIGIDAGATLAAVTWIVLQREMSLLPVAAFAGAVITAVAIYLLSWRGGVSPNRLILVGIGIAAIVSAGSSYMLVKFPIEQARPAIVWTMGSIYGSTWGDVVPPLLALVVLVPAAILLMEPLRAMMLGDVVTRSLGIPLERTRLLLMIVGCALAAISVAIAGPIGFIALMVPHMARMIAGPHSGSVLLFTGVLGSLLLLLADIAAQYAFPLTLPVGVVTSAVGAPYFLYLLYRSNSHT